MGYSWGYVCSFCCDTKPVIFLFLFAPKNVKLQTKQLSAPYQATSCPQPKIWLETRSTKKAFPWCRGPGGDRSQVLGVEVGVMFRQQGACWQWVGSEVLGWKPFHGSSENQATGPFHLMWVCGRGMATQGCAAARMLVHLSLESRELSGSARVPAVRSWCMDSSGKLAGEDSKASQHESYSLKGKHFIVQFYATIWRCGHLSQRTVSRLVMPGDVKLQPGQASGAKVILNSSQREQEVPGW